MKNIVLWLSIDSSSSLWFYLCHHTRTFNCLFVCHPAARSCHPYMSILLPSQSKFHLSVSWHSLHRASPAAAHPSTSLKKSFSMMTHEEAFYYFCVCICCEASYSTSICTYSLFTIPIYLSNFRKVSPAGNFFFTHKKVILKLLHV